MVRLLRGRAFDIVPDDAHDHCFLLDLQGRTPAGDRAASALDRVGISLRLQPQHALAIDTAAIGHRGFDEAAARQLARALCDVLENVDDTAVAVRVRRQIRALCERFPVIRSGQPS